MALMLIESAWAAVVEAAEQPTLFAGWQPRPSEPAGRSTRPLSSQESC